MGDMGHMGGLINPRPGVDNTERFLQILLGLPSLERGRRVKNIFEKNQEFGLQWDLLH